MSGFLPDFKKEIYKGYTIFRRGIMVMIIAPDKSTRFVGLFFNTDPHRIREIVELIIDCE